MSERSLPVVGLADPGRWDDCRALWLALRRWPYLLTRLSPWLSRMSGSAGLLWWPVAYLVLTRALLQPFFPHTRALVGDWFAHSQFAAMFLLGAVLAPAAPVTTPATLAKP